MTTPPEVVRFHDGFVRVRDEASLRDLFGRDALDFGCRPRVSEEPGGTFVVPVIGTKERLAALRADGFDVTIHELPEPQRDIGTGDRFDGGRTYPRGYGVKATDDHRGPSARRE